MKTRYYMAMMTIAALAFSDCSKSSSGSNAPAGASQWTLSGTTYTGLATIYDDTNASLATLTSADAGGNYIAFVFYSHPAAGGTYTVSNGSSPGSTDCLIQVATISGGTSRIYSSTGKTGDKVTLSISGGKRTVSFTGVTVAYNSTTATVSGTLTQQ